MIFWKRIYASWVGGQLISLAGLAVVAAVRRRAARTYLPNWKLVRGLGRAALEHHALNIALQAPPAVMPLIVTTMFSASINAYFYVANMIATLCLPSSGYITGQTIHVNGGLFMP